MPPKKKKGKGMKKKKKDDSQFELEDKYKRTVDEIEALKDHLAIRKDLTRRAQTASSEWQRRMLSAEGELEEQMGDHRAVSSDMSRQYKTMQTEMGLRMHELETELSRTRQQLSKTELELKKTIEEKDKIIREKETTIDILDRKIDDMERNYEGILDSALENLKDKIVAVKEKWEGRATILQDRSKQALLEFGLNPLDI